MSRQMRQFENEKDLDYIGTVNRQFGHIRLWIRITRTSAINLRLIASLAVAFIAFRLPAEPVGERSIMAVAIGSAGFLLAALAVLAWHRLTQLYFATISQRVLKATKPPIERGHVAKP